MSQYESSVKNIPYPQARVYAKLEDLNNLEGLKDRIPQDKVKEFTYSRDEATVNVPPMGNVTIRVVEREEPKCIKLEAVGSPIPINLWVQIIPDGEEASKMRVVIKAEVNFMLRSMIEKPLKDGIEKIAEALSMIAY
ncbi:MAG: SRPBCC family protein [Bacteroidaceae bacterium]|jgi:carbon monoxide dehydrogenase subunit G|nr:SRPBCC family protein [Bacteroidaceae bacterium]MBO7240281.1 SRPBCC family protein [Bacteroidaceae bacterium]MBR4967446.1 SRPBCC family protein [Bacteroidaceae bacterium]